VAELVVDAGAVEAPVVDAGLAVTTVDAGAEPDEPIKPDKVKPAKPVVLTTAMVSKAVSGAKAKIQKCFKDHRADLPSPQGTLSLQFVIAGSGKVTQASTNLPNTGVSRCIEGVVKGIAFPRHVDLEVRVPLALGWDVR
jgi:hypothetical protein